MCAIPFTTNSNDVLIDSHHYFNTMQIIGDEIACLDFDEVTRFYSKVYQYFYIFYIYIYLHNWTFKTQNRVPLDFYQTSHISHGAKRRSRWIWARQTLRRWQIWLQNKPLSVRRSLPATLHAMQVACVSWTVLRISDRYSDIEAWGRCKHTRRGTV